MAHIARAGLLRRGLTATPSRALLAPFANSSFRPLNKATLRSTAVRNAFQRPARIAAFHSTPLRAILPPEAQHIEGTVNDPAPVPPPSPTHGSYHWTFERLMSVGLVPLTLAPFIGGTLNPITDAVLCAALLIHSHIGFEAILIDYIPNKRLPRVRKFSMWLLRLATIVVGVGLYEFETNDVGITQAVHRIWTA